MAIQPARRIEGVGTSVFTEMSALARQHGAVNLGQGFPDFPGPAAVKDAAAAAIHAEHNQYAPMQGLPAVQDAAARAFQRHHGRAVDGPSEVTVTSGTTEALLVSLLAFVEPGDEVLLLEPYYDAYPAQVRMAGAVPVFVRLGQPGWRLDVDAIRSAITPRTRAIMLNNPVNPCGRVFSREELEALARVCVERDLLVIADEVYEQLVFPPHAHVPMALLPGMWERTITIHSTGKTFSVTGWKVGYAIAPPALTDGIRRVHQFCTFATATPLQHGVLAGFAAARAYEAEFLAEYEQRRDLLVTTLKNARFDVVEPQGTYFVMAGYRHIRDVDDVAFCRWLTSEVGVAAIPPSAFFHDAFQCGQVRFCFAKSKATIQAAAQRLGAMVGGGTA